MKKVLVLCTGNSCRSQMAEVFARRALSNTNSVIQSAGLRPDGINKLAAKVMSEVGIDISHQESTNIKDVDLNNFDIIVTVCDRAKESCPLIYHKKLIHKN